MNLVTLARLRELRFPDDPTIGEQRLRRWCRDGALPARKIGRDWLVDLEAFDTQGGPALVDRLTAAFEGAATL